MSGGEDCTIRSVDESGYREFAGTAGEDGCRLTALWGARTTGFCGIFSAFSLKGSLRVARLPVADGRPSFPSISGLFPAAARMERAVRDLFGMDPEGLSDPRPWLDHGTWAKSPPVSEAEVHESSGALGEYRFVPVEGEGVHEIPVGPVHAGVIEPGHFRFQVVGEKVLRMEERLGFVHKGIDALYRGASWEKGVRLSGRVSGDTTVGHAMAFSEAMEAALEISPPPRALWLRALFLERERIANHLGDLGALANDAGLAFGLSQFLRLKEMFFRQNRDHFGHRLLMDLAVPGGVSRDLGPASGEALIRSGRALESEVRILENLYEEHGGLQDRFLGTGILTPETARRIGLTGVVGRASGQATDLRADRKRSPYDILDPSPALEQAGDVRARVSVRFFELRESLRLERLILEGLPGGPVAVDPPDGMSGREGIGWVDGWRGEILCWVRLGSGRTLEGAHSHDPSWSLWPALELAVPGNLVADFPLINKSFNPSYSGHDV